MFVFNSTLQSKLDIIHYSDIKTQICVKSPSVDRWVSGGILDKGVWEGDIVTEVMRSMDNYPEAVFMDIGANIGRYK